MRVQYYQSGNRWIRHVVQRFHKIKEPKGFIASIGYASDVRNLITEMHTNPKNAPTIQWEANWERKELKQISCNHVKKSDSGTIETQLYQ